MKFNLSSACLHAFQDNSPEFSTTAVNHPVKSSLEVKGVTTLTLAVAAAELFKGVNFLLYRSHHTCHRAPLKEQDGEKPDVNILTAQTVGDQAE